MKRIVAMFVAVLVLAGVGVVVYPSLHTSLVRHRAEGHVRDADALARQMRSPVGQQTLMNASDQLKFAMMRSETPIEEIAKFDDVLVKSMAALKASPPPDNPIQVTASVDSPSVKAGDTVTVHVSVRPAVPQAFLVNVSAQIAVDQGWRSNPARQMFNKAIDAAPIDATLQIPIPADVAGPAHLRVTVAYRLDPTGEGMELRAQPVVAPAITIEKGRQ